MAAPVPAAFSELTGADRTTAAVPVPSGTAANDVVVIGLYREGNDTITAPAGFTERQNVTCTGADFHEHRVFWKRLSGADAGTYDFTWTALTWSEAWGARFTGALLVGDPFDATFNVATSNSVGSLTTTPAVSTFTPAENDCTIIFSGTNWLGGTWTPPAGFTERVDHGGAITMATLAQTTAAATGSVSGTCANAREGRTGMVGALRSQINADGAVTTPAITCTGTVAGVVGKVTGTAGTTTASGTVSTGVILGDVTGPVTVAGSVVGRVGRVTGAAGAVTAGGTVAGAVAGVIPVLFPAEPLPIKVELDIAGAWADITSYVYFRDGITITRGRPDEGADVNPTMCTMTLNNRDGRFSPRNPTGTYYGLIGRNTTLRVSLREQLGWLQINQPTGTTLTPTHVSAPDAAGLDITGDIDIRFEADLDSWRDAMELVSKWTDAGDQRSYRLRLNSAGTFSIAHSTDGTAGGALAASSTVPIPITSGHIAIRGTLDVSDAGNRVRTFYVAPTLDGPWEQLGDPVTTAGTTSVFASTASVYVLDNPNDTGLGSTIRGKVYGVQILNGIGGTVVASPDFTIQDEGFTSFTDTQGNTWTVTGDADITHYDTRFVGEVTSFPQAWDVTGTDVYSSIQASGPLRRLLQGSAIGSTLYRGSSRDTDVVAYWPMEDGSNATAFGSARTGGLDMAVSSTTVLATDSSFACSDPLPRIGQSPLRARVVPYPSTGEILVQFLLLIPDAGLSADSTIATISCGGTAPTWNLVYGVGGTLSLRAIDSGGSLIDTTGPGGFLVDGDPMMVKVRLTNSGGNVTTQITTSKVGGNGSNAISDSVASRQIGSISAVVLNPGSVTDYDNVVIGHLAVTTTVDALWEELDQINAWIGESATDRIKRLADEEGIQFCPVGPRQAGDSVAMGPQRSDTLINLLREAANSDLGILFEGRQFLELRFRPRKAIQSQRSDLELDYELHQMSKLEPVEDDLGTRNDITVSRVNGGSARAELTTGPLSTNIPPAGVGRYDTSVSVSLQNDSTLTDQANFRVHLGTVDEARYPRLSTALESSHLEDLQIDIHRMDLGDRLTISGSPSWLAQQDILQLVQGYTEILGNFTHRFEWNLSPARSWDIGVYDDHYDRTRWANGDCTTTEALDSTETGVDVLTGSSGKRWSATAVPYDVMIGGEQMTVTSVSGATNTQTLTVTRSVNGVVKSHVSGVSVELYPLSYYGL